MVTAIIPLTLIYQGELGNLKSKWDDDISQDIIYLAVTPNRWINNKISR